MTVIPNAHLLIIEDDSGVARSLIDGLERDGFRVTWKTSGSEGVGFARKQLPHLVILDVRLPDGSGFDFCRQLRQLGMRQPILMLTVQHEETDNVLGLAIVRAIAQAHGGQVRAESLPAGGARFSLCFPAGG